jgi:hypothetical protein
MTKTADRAEGDAPFLGALLKRAVLSSSSPALQEKRRGVWVLRQWRDVVEEVDRLAAGLAALGARPGATVAIDGEIGPRIVLAAAAASALGARLLSIPTRASRQERDRVMDDPSVALVIGRGREVVAEWVQIAASGRRIPIVFDHATAGGRAPADGVLTYDALRALAAPAGWRVALPSPPPRRAHPKLWIEESTDWTEGLEAILGVWVQGGFTLALPELLAASDRDRREIAPESWLASAETVERAAARIIERLPLEGTFSATLLGKALDSESRIGSAILRPRLRGLLGLGALDRIEVGGGDRLAPSPSAYKLFARLGAAPRAARSAAIIVRDAASDKARPLEILPGAAE